MLSEDVVWAYLAQITLALYDCHTELDNKGERKAVILHRDIKPENGVYPPPMPSQIARATYVRADPVQCFWTRRTTSNWETLD